jgi:hypothetical protein
MMKEPMNPLIFFTAGKNNTQRHVYTLPQAPIFAKNPALRNSIYARHTIPYYNDVSFLKIVAM